VSLQAIGITVGADYLITGSVQRIARRMRVCIQLNNVEASNQLWAHTFDQAEETDLSGEFLEDVVERVLAALAGIEGVIARYENSKKAGPAAETYKSNSLGYWYTQYRLTYDRPTIQKAKRYYQEVIKNEPDNVAALTFLSEILCGEMLLLQRLDESALKRSFEYAVAAIKIDPYYQPGYLALSISHLLAKRIDECLHVLEQGLEINPKSAEYKGAMGGILIFAGQFESGSKFMTKAIKLNVRLPWWQTLSLGYYAYHKKRYSEALLWADRTNRNLIWVSLLKAASYAQLDQPEEGNLILDQMRQQFAIDHLSEEKLKVTFSSEVLLTEILGGLKKLPYMFSPALLALAI
jgi:tetratricopeptide (TPR) repeat protein